MGKFTGIFHIFNGKKTLIAGEDFPKKTNPLTQLKIVATYLDIHHHPSPFTMAIVTSIPAVGGFIFFHPKSDLWSTLIRSAKRILQRLRSPTRDESRKDIYVSHGQVAWRVFPQIFCMVCFPMNFRVNAFIAESPKMIWRSYNKHTSMESHVLALAHVDSNNTPCQCPWNNWWSVNEAFGEQPINFPMRILRQSRNTKRPDVSPTNIEHGDSTNNLGITAPGVG